METITKPMSLRERKTGAHPLGGARVHSAALLEQLKLADIVPPSYGPWQPLLADGLAFFLEHLPSARRTEILARVGSLPSAASPAQCLAALLRQCPTLHKLGQIVAHDRRLAPGLRQRLQALEALAPGKGMGDVAAIVRRELGEVPGLELGTALAEGSVALVTSFAWRDSAGSQEGVFKVLKAGIEQKLAEELDIWPSLGMFLEERCSCHGLPVLEIRSTLDSVQRLLRNEVRLDREQEHLVAAAAFYRDTPSVLIPHLFSFCTPRITAMTQLDGNKVTTGTLSADERRRLVRLLIDALLAKPFLHPAGAVFHADPHAGNLLVTPDGHLVILDWALVARLDERQQAALMRVVLGALTLDVAAVCGAISDLGRVRAPQLLNAVVSDALEGVCGGTLPGFDWLMSLFDRLAMANAMQFQEDIILLRKSLLTLTGVLGDIAPHPSVDDVLMSRGLRQFLQDLARRPWAAADSRAFGSHLSNLDLFKACVGLPLTLARFWSSACREGIDVWQPDRR